MYFQLNVSLILKHFSQKIYTLSLLVSRYPSLDLLYHEPMQQILKYNFSLHLLLFCLSFTLRQFFFLLLYPKNAQTNFTKCSNSFSFHFPHFQLFNSGTNLIKYTVELSFISLKEDFVNNSVAC